MEYGYQLKQIEQKTKNKNKNKKQKTKKKEIFYTKFPRKHQINKHITNPNPTLDQTTKSFFQTKQ